MLQAVALEQAVALTQQVAAALAEKEALLAELAAKEAETAKLIEAFSMAAAPHRTRTRRSRFHSAGSPPSHEALVRPTTSTLSPTSRRTTSLRSLQLPP